MLMNKHRLCLCGNLSLSNQHLLAIPDKELSEFRVLLIWGLNETEEVLRA